MTSNKSLNTRTNGSWLHACWGCFFIFFLVVSYLSLYWGQPRGKLNLYHIPTMVSLILQKESLFLQLTGLYFSLLYTFVYKRETFIYMFQICVLRFFWEYEYLHFIIVFYYINSFSKSLEVLCKGLAIKRL